MLSKINSAKIIPSVLALFAKPNDTNSLRQLAKIFLAMNLARQTSLPVSIFAGFRGATYGFENIAKIKSSSDHSHTRFPLNREFAVWLAELLEAVIDLKHGEKQRVSKAEQILPIAPVQLAATNLRRGAQVLFYTTLDNRVDELMHLAKFKGLGIEVVEMRGRGI